MTHTLPAGEASWKPPAPFKGTGLLSDALATLKDWPGMPQGARALVTRRISETETHEQLFTVGYLRIGVEGQPDNRIYDHQGSPTLETMREGDFIDGYEHVCRWLKLGATLQRPVPADGAARSFSASPEAKQK